MCLNQLSNSFSFPFPWNCFAKTPFFLLDPEARIVSLFNKPLLVLHVYIAIVPLLLLLAIGLRVYKVLSLGNGQQHAYENTL